MKMKLNRRVMFTYILVTMAGFCFAARTNRKNPPHLPTTVVLDKSGKVRLHHTGFANYASDKFVKEIEELINEQ